MDTNDPKLTRTIRKYSIRIDQSLCIGAATCVALAPKAYTLDDEAKAILLDTASEETDEGILNAAKGCPVVAITVINNETGKQIFP
jgi:ferredoxin